MGRRLWQVLAERRIWQGLARPALAVVLIGQLVFALVLGLDAAGYLERFELIAYDAGLRWRADTTAKDPRIAVIGITEEDLAHYGYPIDDGTLAAVIQRVLDCGAQAVGVDLIRDHPIGPGSDTLAALLTANRNIIWIYRFAGDSAPGTPPPAVLEGTGQAGFADMIADRDSVIRRALLYLESDSTFSESMALRMVELFLVPRGIRPEGDPERPALLRLGAATYVPIRPNDGGYRDADTRGTQIFMDYALGPDPFPWYTVGQVLANDLPQGGLAGHLVFIGPAAETVKDSFDTPFTSAGGQGDMTYGVALHALIAGQLLRNALDRAPVTRTLDWRWELGWVWGWCLLGAVWGCFATSAVRFPLGAAGGAAAIGGLWYAALANYLWIPLLPAALGWICSATLLLAYRTHREKGDRQAIMRLFSSYVSETVARAIWQQREAILAGSRPRPQRLTATVMFSDIEGFTPISEHLNPEDVMDWLNELLDMVIGTVMAQDGVVIRFTGHGILAAFGVPLRRESEAEFDVDATRAIDCALAISRRLLSMNQCSRARGLPTVKMCIGIHTGPVVVGSLGRAERMEYAVIGDTVNVAERLQTYARELPKLTGIDHPSHIAVSGTTWRRLKKRYLGYSVGEVSLKGREQGIEVYQLTRLDGDLAVQSSPVEKAS